MQKPDPSSIPLSPGVYLYKDAKERIIYVGKARILRRRVLSYFRPDNLPKKTIAMLAHAKTIDYLTTTTEKEALLLEASLIKKHRPHYNIVLRDDKQYVLFKINIKQEFPRIEIVRKPSKDGARYFGPFTSAFAARQTWKLLHKTFPLRRCSDRAMKNRIRPCLYHHMHQCPAPCMNNADPKLYFENIQRVISILQGNANELIKELKSQMEQASKDLEFELAAQIRDQIYFVEKTVEHQAAVLPGKGDMDAIGLYESENGLALGIIFVRNGSITDGQSFFWPKLDLENAPELMASFISQYYNQIIPPPRILLPWIPDEMTDENEEKNILESVLSDKRNGHVNIISPQNQTDNKLIDIARANAKEETRKKKDEGQDILEKIKSALNLKSMPNHIECIDISHTSGKQTKAGMVVFIDGKPSHNDYRLYSLPDGNDDYGNLTLWMEKRIKSGPPWPDLLLIDGGLGQLNVINKFLEKTNQKDLFSIAAIAKARNEQGRADRRAGNVADRIFIPNRSNPLNLKEGCPELLFLQHIRDLTHNFSITRHRRARTKSALSNELMRLSGIGPKTARLLWDKFETLEAIRKANIEELASIEGIGLNKAQKLQKQLITL